MPRLRESAAERRIRDAPVPVWALGSALLLLAVAGFAQAADTVTWKPISDAILRVDDRAPKQWSLYRVDKKTDSLLLQLGGRFLLVRPDQESVFELSPTELKRRGSDLLWRATDPPGKALPSAEWTSRDVGAALRILFRLTGEGRQFDIQLPHAADFRGL